MAKKLRVDSPADIAAKLIGINGEILAYEEPLKQLKDKRDEMRQLMVDSLKENRLEELRTEDGVTYTRAFRNSYKIADPKKAMPWLTEHDCLKPDTVKLGKLLKGVPVVPEGIEWTETEYLSTTGMKDALTEF